MTTIIMQDSPSLAFMLIAWFIIQSLLVRIVRNLIDKRLSHHLSYDKKRQTQARPSSLLAKLLILYNSLPFLHLYTQTLHLPWTPTPSPALHPTWTPAHNQNLDTICALLTSTYLFEIIHNNAPPKALTHHLTAILGVLTTLHLRHHHPEPLQHLLPLFIPFFVPGISIAEVSGDLAHLLYRLVPYKTPRGPALIAYAATLHLLARCLQWLLIAAYMVNYHRRILATTGPVAASILAAALALWANLEANDCLFFLSLAQRFATLRREELRAERSAEAKAVSGGYVELLQEVERFLGHDEDVSGRETVGGVLRDVEGNI